jgi:hypothetical protein
MREDTDSSVWAARVRGQILDEVFVAFGSEPQGWPRKWLWPPFWPAAYTFGKILESINSNVERLGVQEAARLLLPRFVKGYQAEGVEQIPLEGPLIVASNHPGAYDSVVILASLPRPDVKIVVSDVPFLRELPALDSHFIYTLAQAHGRMTTVRGMLRHVQEGGAVLIFASGLVDPDPAVLPDASQALEQWSPSLDLVLRKTPETRIVPTIVSGVLSPACLHSWLTRLQSEEWKKRKLAEFLQVIQQLIFKREFGLTPKVSFGAAKTATELLADGGSSLLGAIIGQAQGLLQTHLEAGQARP